MLKRFRVDPRDVLAEDFPKDGTTREKMLFLLRFAILAPSIHNTQPWKFSVDRDRIGLFADRTRWLAGADPDQRDLRLSLGCVLENLLVAARHYGYVPQVTYSPRASSPDFIAVVDLSRCEPRGQRRDVLLDALKRRHTTQRESDSRPVLPSLLEDLSKACAEEGVALFITPDPGIRSAAAELFGRANAIQFGDEGFRAELGNWLARGGYGLLPVVTRLRRNGLPHLEKELAKEAQRMAASPYLGAILTQKDDAIAQVRAGQAFERVWLAAARWSVNLRPASALCQVPPVKAQFARLVEAGESHVQQVFRLGHGQAQGARTPRRRVDEVLAAIPLA